MGSRFFFDIKKIAILLIAAAVAVLFSYYVHLMASEKAENARNRIISVLENRFSRNISFSTVDPFFINGVTVHDIILTDDTGREILNGSELTVRFNFFKWLFKREFIVSGIEFNDGTVNLQQTLDSDLFDSFETDNREDIEKEKKPGRKIRNFRFSGKNIKADFLTEYGNISLEKFFADIVSTPESHTVKGRSIVSGSSLVTPALDSFRTRLEFDANIDRLEKTGEGNIRLRNFTSNLADMGRMSLHIDYDSGKVIVRNVEDSTPIDYELTYYRKSGRTEFRTVFEKLRISDSLTFRNGFSKYNKFAEGAASGDFNIVYTPKNVEKFAYSGNMEMLYKNTDVAYEPLFRTSFTGTDATVNFSYLTLETDNGNGAYHGTVNLAHKTVDGNLILDRFNAGRDMYVTTEFDISHQDSTTLMVSEKFEINGYDFGSCTVKADTENKNGSVVFEKDNLETLYFRGEMLGNGNIRGYVTTNGLDSRGIEAILNRNIIPGFFSLELDSDIFFITTDDNIYVTCRDILVSDRSDRNNFLRFSAVSTLDNASINDISLSYGKASGKGFLNITDMRKDFPQLKSMVSVNEINYEFSGYMNKGKSLYLKGEPGLSLSADFNGDRSTLFSLRADNFPVYIKDRKSVFNLNVNGVLEEEKLPMLNINRFAVSDLFFLRGSDNRISFSGSLRNSRLIVPSWRVRDAFSTVSGTAEGSFEDGRNMGGWFRGNGNSDNEEYIAYFSIKDGNIDIDSTVKNARLERFTKFPATGILSGQARISGTLESPVAEISAAVENGTVFREPMNFRTSVLVTENRSEIRSFSGIFGNVDILSTLGFIDWTDRAYNIDSNIILRSKVDENSSAPAVFSASGTIEEEGSWIINPALKKNRGKMQLSSPSAVLIGYREWAFDYSNDGNMFTINGGPYENSVSGKYFSDGNFELFLKAPFFVTGDIKGTLKNGYMDALVNNAYADLGAVGQLMGESYFKPLSGNAIGTLRINGSINNPDIWGVMNAEDIYFALHSVPDILGPSSAEVFFQGKEIKLQPARIDLSPENFATVNAEFIHEHWIPDFFTVNVSVFGNPKKGTKISDTFAGIDFNGYAHGNLTVSGSNQTYWVDGDVQVNDCIINLSKNFYDEPVEDPNEYIINMKLRSGTGVEFFWPTQKLPVLRAYADRNQTVTINLDSSSQVFNIDGNVNFKGGDIFYFSNNFFIREGNLFFHENQDKFDPRITVNAEMRTINRNNEKVRVLFILDNSPLSNFQPRIESVPALPQAELYELLGDTIMGGDPGDEERTTMSTLANASAYGTQLLGIFRPLERTVKDIFNLDLFSIQAQLSDKIFNNRKNEEKSNIDMKRISTTTYLNNIDIFMGKYFGKYFFLDTTLRFSSWDFDTFEYYDYDMPVFGNMYIESEINFEAETPLFILNLGLYPKFGNIKDSMLDTTIGISWRLTY